MTHTPPIPTGNQSPYPLQEPPHAPTVTGAEIATREAAEDRGVRSRATGLPRATIGAAVGVGIALIGGVLLGLRGASAKGRAKPRRT